MRKPWHESRVQLIAFLPSLIYCSAVPRPLDKLWAVVEQLLKDEPLERRHRAHTLSGQWQSFRECHIEPDLILARTGTHADLFE